MCAANNITSFRFTKSTVHIKTSYFRLLWTIILFFFSENIEFDDGDEICAGVDDFVAAVYDRKVNVDKVIEIDDADIYVSFLNHQHW